MKLLHISKVYYLVLSLFFALNLSASVGVNDTYIVTPADIAKSSANYVGDKREKFEQMGGDPWEEAQKIIEETKNMSDEEFLKYMEANEDRIKGVLNSLNEMKWKMSGKKRDVEDIANKNTNRSSYDKSEVHRNHTGKNWEQTGQLSKETTNFDTPIYKLEQLLARYDLVKKLGSAEGVRTFDKKFREIFENPKYAGKITPKTKPELAKELAREIFAGFSPEFQKAFMDMHLRLEVKKYEYPDKIKVYIVYGIDKDGDEAKFQFMDSRWEDMVVFVVNDVEVGKALAERRKTAEGKVYIQEIREKNGEIEKLTIKENGEVSFSKKVKKFPSSEGFAVN